MTRTHYDILGVKEGATYEEIRTRYRSSILNYHPDKLPKADGLSNSIKMADDKFLEIQRAWEILGDPTSRAVYDIELQTLKQDTTTSEDISIEDLTIEYAGDLVELFYQCRCGDHFSIDSVELEEMGYILSMDGDTVSLQTLNSYSASVVLPCGSCSLKIRLLINIAENIR
ncbi:hypothetical protein DCAR_0207192 [Daucus carota subsp. sativus]|uniref:J domain-containing protein n=2 Tax=Daucus carota subsp. sativus TaxID=79200 RepID=A0AAF1ALU9_DAUCS|nr:hypothetical protein DCAR_0207192 [Daucus carota subsp. sativus]